MKGLARPSLTLIFADPETAVMVVIRRKLAGAQGVRNQVI